MARRGAGAAAGRRLRSDCDRLGRSAVAPFSDARGGWGAAPAVLGGATFHDVARMLVDGHDLDPADAVLISERAFRGGDGIRPGLGRERVYLESLVRVRRHLANRPQDEEVLACGQVAVEACEAL